MEDNFSWSDTVYAAFGSCLSCLKARPSSPHAESSASDRPHQNFNHIACSIRSDELEGLLADSPDTDDAETLSLHSNPGRVQGRRKGKGLHKTGAQQKSITLFGWNLFGRRKPPIQLPPDDEEGIDGTIRPPRLRSRAHGTSNASTSTLDSDAPQLSPTIIDSMSPEQLRDRAIAAEAAEAEERRLKEERRQRRREKRELKRAAMALATGGDGEFEGFQGSGSGYPAIPSPFHSRAPTSPSVPDSTPEGYGPFVGATSATLIPHADNEDGDDAADLDGGVYTRRAPGSSSGGSDSRSRTSASRSQSDVSHSYHPISQPPHPHQQLHPHLPLRQDRLTLELTPSTNVIDPQRKRLKKSKSSSKSKSSTTSRSESPSIRSPVSPGFAHMSPDVALGSPVPRYDGLAHDDMALEQALDRGVRSGFPSSGLMIGKRPSNNAMGAFLANTSQS